MDAMSSDLGQGSVRVNASDVHGVRVCHASHQFSTMKAFVIRSTRAERQLIVLEDYADRGWRLRSAQGPMVAAE